MPLDPSILIAAVSALVGCPVITYDEYLSNPLPGYQSLDLDAFHKTLLVAPSSPLTETGRGAETRRRSETPELVEPPERPPITIFIKTLTGQTITLPVTLTDTISSLKHKIAPKVVNFPPSEQLLIYGGKHLQDTLTLQDYDVRQDSTLHLGLRVRHRGLVGMYLSPNFVDPGYDFNFTDVDDSGTTFSRGNEEYKRPCGWLRYALKVDRKYGDDSWLGASNAPGEWPVSYHGTGKHNAESIAQVGYKLSRGVSFAYGKGIYSSPDVTTAQMYAQDFTTEDGRRGLVIIQNRINGENLNKVPKLGSNSEYWVSPADEDIRPYGLCVKLLV